jgi:hypothetical protein
MKKEIRNKEEQRSREIKIPGMKSERRIGSGREDTDVAIRKEDHVCVGDD